VLLDESPDTLNDGAFAVRMDPYGTFWQDSPTILHDGGCSFAFGDGHSDIKRWTDQRTLYLKVGYGSTPVHYGISQPNNADIMWLQDRTTAPKR
jgi:prepilin-type processing-associated H-X9-DG protein